MNRILRQIIIPVFAGVSAYHSTVASAETLSEALRHTLENNAAINAQRSSERAAFLDKKIARAGSLPQISISGSINNIERSSRSEALSAFNRDENLNQMSMGATIEQPLFRGLRSFHEIKKAKAEFSEASANTKAVEQQILLDAANIYLSVIHDKSVVRLQNSAYNLINLQLEQARARFDAGAITKTDIAQAEARLSAARADLILAKTNLTRSRRQYEAIIGHPPVDLSAPTSMPDIPSNSDEAVAIAIKKMPILNAARYRHAASAHAVKSARGALLPTLSAFARYRFDERPAVTVDSNESFAYGMRLSLPLFQGGENYARLKKQKHLRNREGLTLRNLQNEAATEAAAAWDSYQASKLFRASAVTEMHATEIALAGVKAEVEYGGRTTLDALNAEQESLDANIKFLAAKRDEYLSAILLLQSIGDLTLERLFGASPDNVAHIEVAQFLNDRPAFEKQAVDIARQENEIDKEQDTGAIATLFTDDENRSFTHSLRAEVANENNDPPHINHTVLRGDTLYSIARRHGVSVYALAKTNNITPPFEISIEQQLKIPSVRSKNN